VKETCFVVDHGHEGTKLYIFGDIPIASIDGATKTNRCAPHFSCLALSNFNNHVTNLVENSIGILKKMFKELLLKTNLHTFFC